MKGLLTGAEVPLQKKSDPKHTEKAIMEGFKLKRIYLYVSKLTNKSNLESAVRLDVYF